MLPSASFCNHLIKHGVKSFFKKKRICTQRCFMDVCLGLILLYPNAWADLREQPVPVKNWQQKEYHLHPHQLQPACCVHKIVLLVKNRTTCTSKLRQLDQNLWNGPSSQRCTGKVRSAIAFTKISCSYQNDKPTSQYSICWTVTTFGDFSDLVTLLSGHLEANEIACRWSSCTVTKKKFI